MATYIEKEFVLDTYEHIAEEFSSSRYSVWTFVKEFLHNKDHLYGLDVGCGNGKNMIHRKMVGIDNNQTFVNICKESGKDVILADCMNIPFNEEMFDYIMCISVIHHLSTDERRKECIKNILHVLKTGGHGLINVWSCEHQNKHTFVDGDNYVPWKSRMKPEDIKLRYYNIMNHNRFIELINSFHKFINIVDIWNEKGNWIVHFIKI
jgi:tRNA (uracil-5-)-methyltransferase TRM9